MAANELERQGSERHDDALEMDDQGPSYGSSYNESEPGEIIENRRASLDDEQEIGQSSQNAEP